MEEKREEGVHPFAIPALAPAPVHYVMEQYLRDGHMTVTYYRVSPDGTRAPILELFLPNDELVAPELVIKCRTTQIQISNDQIRYFLK